MALAATSLVKKNKRKSLEPRRLAAADVAASNTSSWLGQQHSPHPPPAGFLKHASSIEKEEDQEVRNRGGEPAITAAAVSGARCRLNSTGSEERSPTTTEYTSDSRTPSPMLLMVTSPHLVSTPLKCSTELGKRSNSNSGGINNNDPSCLAPKKRFKFDALRDLERASTPLVQAVTESPLSLSSGAPPAMLTTAITAAALAGGASCSEQLSPLLIPTAYLPFLLPGIVAGGGGIEQASLGPLHPRLFPFPISLASPPTVPPLLQQPEQDEPLALVVKDKKVSGRDAEKAAIKPATDTRKAKSDVKKKRVSSAAAPAEPQTSSTRRRPSVKSKSAAAVPAERPRDGESHFGKRQMLAVCVRQLGPAGEPQEQPEQPQQQQRNYKNLTRERRVEANARERQRVHTITAAFETLQAAIPSEEENAKLSKLSVIKIATAYIMALSRMAGYDYTEDQSAPSIDTVIQHCQEVIHTETRIKKRSSQT